MVECTVVNAIHLDRQVRCLQIINLNLDKPSSFDNFLLKKSLLIFTNEGAKTLRTTALSTTIMPL